MEKSIVNKPFRFLEAWASNDTSIMVEKSVWDKVAQYGIESHIIRKCLYSTSKALNKWNKYVFGIAQIRIKALEYELRSIHSQNGNTRVKQKVIHKQLCIQRNRLESIYQKLRKVWLKQGDQNSKFFSH